MEPLAPVTPRVRAALISLIAAFGVLLALWAVLTPAFRAPDEIAHFSSVERMATAPSWPDPGEARISGAAWGAFQERTLRASERSTLGDLRAASPGITDHLDWMTQHPPLYYSVVGTVMNLFGIDGMRWDHAMLTMRLLSALMVTPLVWFLFSAVRRLTRSSKAGLIAAVAPFAVPQVQQIGSSVNNDTMLILLGALIGWLSVRILTGDRRWQVLLATGITLGLLALTKGTGLPAALLVALVLLFGAGSPRSWPRRLIDTAWPLAVATAAGLFWWALNVIRFGKIQPSATLSARPDNPWPEGSGPSVYSYVIHLWDGFTVSFWGKLGALEFPLASPLIDILSVTTLVVLVAWGFSSPALRRINWILVAQPIGTILLLLFGTWGVYARTQLFAGIQGRYFFAALVVLVAASALAWMALLPTPTGRRRFGIGFTILAIGMTVYGFGVAYAGFYEGASLRPTTTGIGRWLALSPLGLVPTVALLGVVALAGAVAVALTIREIRRIPAATEVATGIAAIN